MVFLNIHGDFASLRANSRSSGDSYIAKCVAVCSTLSPGNGKIHSRIFTL